MIESKTAAEVTAARILEKKDTFENVITLSERKIKEGVVILKNFAEAYKEKFAGENNIWTPKVIDGIVRAYYRITQQQKWLRYMKPDNFITKDNWEAYRLQLSVILGTICEKHGEKVNWNGLMANQIYRLFKKAYIGDITCEDREKLKGKDFAEIEKAFDKYVKEVIESTTSKAFLKFLESNMTTDEGTCAIYDLAGAYGTKCEIIEISRKKGWVDTYSRREKKKKLKQIQEKIQKGFGRFPYLQKALKSRKLKKLLRGICDGKYILRWQNCHYKISDSSHMLLCAIFEWYMQKEKGNTEKAFISWMNLLFHDSLEILTGDPTSIVKDKVRNGAKTLRAYVDKVADEVAEFVIKKFPKWAQGRVREILTESPEIKPADRLSAVIEALFALRGGSRDEEYIEPFERAQKHSFTPSIDLWVREKYLQAKEIKFI